MLSCAIEYKDVFTRLKLREPRYTSLPTEHDFVLATEICERLQLFYEVTVMFSGSKYPTANVFFPLICEIGYSLRDWAQSPDDVIMDMASRMLLKFEKYWSLIHGIMGMATVLDPRYKLKFVELLLPVLYGVEKANTAFKALEEFVKKLFKEYESNRPSRNEHEGVSDGGGGGGSCSSSFSSGLPAGHRVGFKKIFSDIAYMASEHDDSRDLLTEFDNYLKEKLLPKDMELDLLVWWKTNGFMYPTLQRIAKDVLAVPVSTVASESAFSTSRRLISPRRSRLHPKTLEALMCAQSWLLNEIRETCSPETEAYCRSIDYDYDVEEAPSKESGTSVDDFD